MNKVSTKRGFTLIELLVVIAIIALLSSIVLANLNNARTRAGTAKIISEMKSLQTALVMYHEKNGTYPGMPATGWAIYNEGGSPSFAEALNDLVTQGLISEIPLTANVAGHDPEWEEYQYWVNTDIPSNNFDYCGDQPIGPGRVAIMIQTLRPNFNLPNREGPPGSPVEYNYCLLVP